MKFFKYSTHRGFTLIEMLVYVAILAIMTVAVITVTLSQSQAYADFKVARNVYTSASASLERMVREIRVADNIIIGSSSLDSHPGILTLQKTGAAGIETVQFYLVGGVLKVQENSSPEGALTRKEVVVTNLVFKQIISTASEGVRIEMTLSSIQGNSSKTEQFSTFVIMRNSY